MKAARWLGQRNRLTFSLDIDGLHYAVELSVVHVHCEPDKLRELFDSMAKREAATVVDLAAMEICKRINGR